MATSSMVPYSNPAGKNQTSPALSSTPQPIATLPTAQPMNPTGVAAANPLIPPSAITSGTVVPGAGGPTSAQQGFITNNTSTTNGNNNLLNQETDIYGQGVGASIFSLLNNMSGTNSTMLQEYINSLAPQEATAQANLDTSLGAGGVSPNSSVAAIGNANLQAQEFAQISNESANLTKSQEDLTAQILTGQQGAAASEVASSGWDVLGSVLSDAGSIAGDVLGVGGITGGKGLSGLFGGGSSVPSAGGFDVSQDV